MRVAIFLLAFLLVACDPGIALYPVGPRRIAEYAWEVVPATNGRTFAGKFEKPAERTAGPGETKSIDAQWELDQNIGNAFGDTATLTIEMRHGDRKQTVAINYRRP